MADLIKEFFERELSGAEADSLGELLQKSPEESLRFEGFLEKHYLATGLPMPQVPSGMTLPPGTGGLGLMGKILGVALVALTGAGVLWKFWPHAPVETPLKSITSPILSAPIKATLAPQLQSRTRVMTAPIQPMPVGPTAEGEALSVVVGTQTKALVTVRVLDSTRKEVRNLYTGFVQPGHWSFRWDGELANGVPAPAGDYQIDVQSGASHQSKEIRIKPN